VSDGMDQRGVRLATSRSSAVGPLTEFFGVETSDPDFPAIADWLEIALIHDSYLHENRDSLPDVTPGVLRGLEMIGNVWLGRELATRLYLGREFDDVGQLAALHSATMTAFVEWLLSLDWLVNSVRYGKGESQSAPSRQTRRRLANQVSGAMVLAQGESRLRTALRPFFENALTLEPAVHNLDPVTFLGSTVPHESKDWEYLRSGPAHQPVFVAVFVAKDKRTSRGEGKSKKLAREAAARAFIARYLISAPPESPRAKARKHTFTLPSDIPAPAFTRNAIEEIRHEFGLHDRWRPLLLQALVHTSWAYEHQAQIKAGKQRDNSLLAFLGSWVVEYEHSYSVASSALNTKAAELPLLTLSEEQLATVSGQLGLNNAMLLGRGEEQNRGKRISVSANALQAIVAAVFVGLQTPPLLFDKLPHRWSALRATLTFGRPRTSDYKTTLQEFAASAEFDVFYECTSEGPDHVRSFHAEIELFSPALNRRIHVRGPSASSRKGAEQRAAEPIVRVILALGPPLIEGAASPQVRGTAFMMTHLLAVAQARPTIGQRWSKRGLLGAEINEPRRLLRWARAADALLQEHTITSVDTERLSEFYRHNIIQYSRLSVAAKALAELTQRLIELDNPAGITTELEDDIFQLGAVYGAAGDDPSDRSSLDDTISGWRLLYGRDLTIFGEPSAVDLPAAERRILDYLVGRLVVIHGGLEISIAPNSLRIKPRVPPIDGSVVSAVVLSSDVTPMVDIAVDGDTLAVDLAGTARESDGPVADAVISALSPEPSSFNSSVANTLHDMKNEIVASRDAAAAAHRLSGTQRLSRELHASEHLDQAKVLARQLEAVGLLHTTSIGITDLSSYLRNYGARLLQRLPVEIQVITKGPTSPVVVSMDEANLSAILDNLVRNAQEALPNGGTVELSASTDGRVAHVEICDDGPGVPVSVVDALRSGQSVQSTKLTGNGLGLVGVRTLIRRAGGEFTCIADRPGACWQITIPLSDPAAVDGADS
jgi:dsRNA-specific ribonuclease